MNKLFIVLFLLVIVSCKSKTEKIKPLVSGISESVYASGTIKSNQQYQAFASANGVIQTIYVREGDSVEVGSPVLLIANDLQQLNSSNAALTARFNDVGANQGKLSDAKLLIAFQNSKMESDLLMLTRQQNLWKQNIGSKAELEQRELAYENSTLNYKSAVVKYSDLKKQLDYLALQSKTNLEISEKLAGDFTLKSEVNGVVYKLYKEKGEAVNLQTPLALIGNNNQFTLEMQVDEYDIFKIKNGQKVLITMDSYKGKVFEARVYNISPMMNERSKTFLVEASFVKPPEKLYPFVSFEANIVIQTKKKALLIPRNLLLNDSTVVRSDGEKVLIKTGLKDYQMVEIISGINADDELIDPVK